MAQNSKIEWCHHTMNFWQGCTALSPACDHCYAEAWAKRTGNGRLWQGERRRSSMALWRQPVKWDAACAAVGIRQRVFTNSLADFFDNQVPSDWRDDAWDLIAKTRNLDWMVLTKRPQNILKMLPTLQPHDFPWPWRNVWLGTTIEDRARLVNADHLRKVPAVIRFLSIEPLLEDLGTLDLSGIHLVIVGGESGPGARPMNLLWVRRLLVQCEAAGVAFLFKQWGEWVSGEHMWISGGFAGERICEATSVQTLATCSVEGAHRFDDRYFAVRVGKGAAGRLLDGVEHNGMPEVRA